MRTQLSVEGSGKTATQFFQRYQGAKVVEHLLARFIPEVQIRHVGQLNAGAASQELLIWQILVGGC